jgi:hypothetical protein
MSTRNRSRSRPDTADTVLESGFDVAADTSLPQAALARCLHEIPNYVVLRNEEDIFENLRRGGDVDLLVGDVALAERMLIRHLGPAIRIIRSSYVTGYSYDWGHLDLLPTIEWRGARYLRTDAVLQRRRVSARGWPVPRIADEAVISWLTSLLWGGFFKERYATVIRQAVEIDGVAFRQALTEAVGRKWGFRLWRAAADGRPEASADWAHSLRRVVWWRACLSSPVCTVLRWLAFVIGQLRLRFEPPVPWIAILDTRDGLESSVSNEIVQRLGVCPFATVTAFPWHPRRIGRAHGSQLTVDPLGRLRREPIGWWTVLAHAADWVVAYWTRVVHLRAKGYIPACDGTSVDLLVDFARDRETARRLARLLWPLLPKPDLVFVLDSEPEVVTLAASDGLQSDVARRSHAYKAFVRQVPAGYVLNARLPPGTLADEIQGAIRAWLLTRSAVRLGGAQAPIAAVPAANDRTLNAAPTFLSRGDDSRRPAQ